MLEEQIMLHELEKACSSYYAPIIEELQNLSSEDDGDAIYEGLNRFARHLVAIIQEGNETDLESVFRVMERLLEEGNEAVYVRITSEFLEDIQNIAAGEGLDLHAFEQYLLPITKSEWDVLIDFWDDVE